MDDNKQSLAQISLAYDRGQIAVVVELCQKFLQKKPKHGFAWIWYAMALTDLHQYELAQSAVRRAFKFLPSNYILLAYRQMGDLFKAKGDFKRAMFWYRKTSKCEPENATNHIFLGDSAFKYGALKQAEKHFRRALKCSEGCIEEAYFNLGGILLGERKYSEAIKCYEKTLEINPKYNSVKERLDDAKLAQLLMDS